MQINKSNIIKVLTGVSIIALLIFSFVVYEYQASKKELMSALESEATNLSESLNLSFANTLETNYVVENLISEKLEAISEIVKNVDYKNSRVINEIIENYHISFVAIIGKDGKAIFTSDKRINLIDFEGEILSQVNAIFNKEYEWIDLGIIDSRNGEKSNYLMARAGKNIGECIIIGVDSQKILDFRKKIGLGKQIQEIADNEDIAYIVIQDLDGILSASKNLNEINSIESDKFLMDAFASNKISVRLIEYNGNLVFEAVNSITLSDSAKALNRIALSTEKFRKIQQSSMRRVILIGIGIFIVFSLLYSYLTTKQGYKSLSAEHSKFKSYTDLVLENMADAVVAIDKSETIIYFNSAGQNIFGIDAKDALSKSYSQVFNSDLLLLQKAKREKTPIFNIEIDYYRNSVKKTLELSITFIYDEKSEIDTTIAIIKDFSEKKHFLAQLERKEKLSAMGELAGGVAHEIRNPLNSIGIIAQRLQREFEVKEKKEEFNSFIQTIRLEIARVNNIIKQFLDYAKPAKLNKSINSINLIMDECVNLIESEANAKQIIIEKKYSLDFQISVDKEKIKQVLINLLKNAIDSIEQGGKIDCLIERRENSAIIKIIDNGKGISKELLPKIFNLYFTTKPSGNGIGLSVAHQIIDEHNGSITVNSELGKGSDFIISLPINNT